MFQIFPRVDFLRCSAYNGLCKVYVAGLVSPSVGQNNISVVSHSIVQNSKYSLLCGHTKYFNCVS